MRLAAFPRSLLPCTTHPTFDPSPTTYLSYRVSESLNFDLSRYMYFPLRIGNYRLAATSFHSCMFSKPCTPD